MTSKTITLVVAIGDQAERAAIIRFLSDIAGVQVVAEADDGPDALAAIQTHQPQVAILDADSPARNGVKIARAMRAAGLPTQAILLTAHAEPARFEAAREAGAIGYVLKEKALDELLAAIRAAARGEFFISPALAHLVDKRGASPLKF